MHENITRARVLFNSHWISAEDIPSGLHRSPNFGLWNIFCTLCHLLLSLILYFKSGVHVNLAHSVEENNRILHQNNTVISFVVSVQSHTGFCACAQTQLQESSRVCLQHFGALFAWAWRRKQPPAQFLLAAAALRPSFLSLLTIPLRFSLIHFSSSNVPFSWPAVKKCSNYT